MKYVVLHISQECCRFIVVWAPSQYPKRRICVRSRKVSKPRDLHLELSDRSEIWQALRQHCCRCACQISKQYDNLKYQSRGFETLRDLTKRRLFGYWDGALAARHSWPVKMYSDFQYTSEIENIPQQWLTACVENVSLVTHRIVFLYHGAPFTKKDWP